MVIQFEELRAVVENARRDGRAIVMAGGLYDVLHVGHVRHLVEAKEYGDVLVVDMGSDALARLAKGPGRPFTTAVERAEIIDALKPVDFVIITENMDEKWALYEMVRPDFYVRGMDYTLETTLEREAIERHGGRVVFSTAPKITSSTILWQKLRRLE